MDETIPLDRIDAFVFDLDGVITDTASVHAAAWKDLFDGFLSARGGGTFAPFDADEEYRRYVDGKPRDDGVRDFLASRGIALPEGDAGDPPDRETVRGLGDRKNAAFLRRVRQGGADPYPSTVSLVRELTVRGVPVAAISASRNMAEVLESAGVADLFPVRVDGVASEELGLPGKPEPAVFVEAARRLGTDVARTAVVEDAISGVEAARRGGFGFVVAVDRTGHPDALRDAGADVIVSDLAELGLPEPPSVRSLPQALEHADEIRARLADRRAAIFLDYDGTLTPIVDRPEDATLSPEMRASIERLAALAPVAIVSGRDLGDVRRMVGVEGVAYAGSHGLDLLGPDGSTHQHGRELLPALDAAERALRPRVEAVLGARLERKAFAVTVHYREVDEDRVPELDAAVAAVAAEHADLRRTGGKRVFELRPDIDWDKGSALTWLLAELGLGGTDALPVNVGDDRTDEDAFRVVRGRGLGFVVRGEDDDRPTLARMALRDTAEVGRLLELMSAEIGATG